MGATQNRICSLIFLGCLFALPTCGPNGVLNKNSNSQEIRQTVNEQSDGVGLIKNASTSNTVSVKNMISRAGEFQVFKSRETDGYCYRIPSFVHADGYVVALAQRRQGYTADITSQKIHQRPVRLLSQVKLGTVPTCNDEALTSIAVRVAPIVRSPTTQEIEFPKDETWSPEIILVDIGKLRDRALNPSSVFFEPPLYDYFLRLKANKFGRSSTYLACHDNYESDNEDCRARLQEKRLVQSGGNNLFTNYLIANFAVTSERPVQDRHISTWLATGDNAKNLLNIRFGAHSAIGYKDDGSPYLGLFGLIAYPTVPHAPHHDYEVGDTMMKLAALRVNVRKLYEFAKNQTGPISLEPTDSLLEWTNSFNTMAIQSSIENFEAARIPAPVGSSTEGKITPEMISAFETHLNATLGSKTIDLSQTHGLQENITPPKSVGKIIALARSYANVDNPLRDHASLDLESWKRAVISVYRNANIYPEIQIFNSIQAETYFGQTSKTDWTIENLKNIHQGLGIAEARDLRDNSNKQKLLTAVVSAYGRSINIQVNTLARVLDMNQSGKDSMIRKVTDLVRRVFFKKGRIGPGNGVDLTEDKRLFLPVAGGFPFTTSYKIDAIDTNYSDSAIIHGSERQATIIGRSSDTNQYFMFMTMRNTKVDLPDPATGEFDLSTWTRVFSVSLNSGRSWSPDAYVAPQYEGGNTFTQRREQPNPSLMGFESPEIQGSITSVPDFFGRNRRLVLHLHTQNNSRAIRKGKTEPSLCLGDSAGDVTNVEGGTAKSGCDYRIDLTLIPGVVNEGFEKLTVEKTLDGKKLREINLAERDKAITWKFDQLFLVQRGSAGYSAIDYIGRNDCKSAKVGYIYEGRPDNKYEFGGFNNGISVGFAKIHGADFRHLPECQQSSP